MVTSTDQPRQGEYRAICLFRKLENRKKAEICNKIVVLGTNHQKNKHRMQSKQTHSYSALSRMTQACFCTVLSLDVFCVIVLSKFGCQGIQENLTALARGISESAYESFSDVGESRVWFASKNLTPCRIH